MLFFKSSFFKSFIKLIRYCCKWYCYKYFASKKNNLLLSLSYKFFITMLPYIIIVIVWQLIIFLADLPSFVLPSFFLVIQTFINNFADIADNAMITLLEAVSGLFLSIIAAIILGLLFNVVKVFKPIIYKLVLIWQIIPLMAIAPLILIWVGFDIKSKILVVFLSSIFPCLFAFIRGLYNVDPQLIQLMRVNGASSLQIFKLIEFPSSLYSLFSGIKIAVVYSLNSAVTAEYIGANKGLGIYMANAISSFNTSLLFASVLCIIVLTILLYSLVLNLEKIFIPWNQKNMQI
ncbi:ABC transporter permease [Rickettsiales bacterium LUAb2]